MTNESAPELVVIAIEIDDSALLDRLTALLSDIPGLRLAQVGESVDVVLVASSTLASRAEDAALTPRELEVLSLMAEGGPAQA